MQFGIVTEASHQAAKAVVHSDQTQSCAVLLPEQSCMRLPVHDPQVRNRGIEHRILSCMSRYSTRVEPDYMVVDASQRMENGRHDFVRLALVWLTAEESLTVAMHVASHFEIVHK